MSGRPSIKRRYEVLAEIRKDPRASIRELGERTGIKAPSQVYALLRELEWEGLIRREPHMARNIFLKEPTPKAESEKKARGTAPRKKGRPKRKAADADWTVRRKQSPEQLAKAIERVVRTAETKAASHKDGEQWFLRKEYR